MDNYIKDRFSVASAASLAAGDDDKYRFTAADLVRGRYGDRTPLAYVHTYGCQGNVSDSEYLKGMLRDAGFGFCSSPADADLVLFNTCAVREHAQDRVFGNIGALKPLKEKNRSLIIIVCGCMTQQPGVVEKISKSYDFVDIVFGTGVMKKFYGFLCRALSGYKVRETAGPGSTVEEGVPTFRDRDFKVWLPVMYGCDNFCSYCIVPYVRGRERSREPERVLEDAHSLVSGGAKDITLLGQNVNSYGKGLSDPIGFPELLSLVCAVEGDFRVRFMTSHPKDCSTALLESMASNPKAAKHLHLPVQSGSNRILRLMNRGYDRERYLSLIREARSMMPDLSITSDIIVGFPGETEEDFQDTLSLVEEVGFTSLYTFIYSPRSGTRAAKMPDPVTHEEKAERMKRLCSLQESIARSRSVTYVGKRFRVLAEKWSGGRIEGRAEGNYIISFPGDESEIGSYTDVEVTSAGNYTLEGKAV